MQIEISPLLRRCLDATSAELTVEFRGVFSPETVARCVQESYEQLGDRPTVGPNFLPVIVVRFARERLWAVAQADGTVEKPLPEVLFVCEHNSGRSQIAAFEFPKPLTDEVVRAADVVVTLGCGDACAVCPGKRYQDWPVSDPAGQSLEVVRQIRYELYHHVWDLLETLVPTGGLVAIHRPIGGRP